MVDSTPTGVQLRVDDGAPLEIHASLPASEELVLGQSNSVGSATLTFDDVRVETP